MPARRYLVAAAAFGAAVLLAGLGCPRTDPALEQDEETTDPVPDPDGTAAPDAARTDPDADPEEARRLGLDRPVLPPVAAEEAPEPSPRLEGAPSADRLADRIGSYFEGRQGRRLHVQVDRPLYTPGDTVWLRAWDLSARDLAADRERNVDMDVELVGPRGDVVLRRRFRTEAGLTRGDLDIPDGAAGGEYKVRVRIGGVTEERPIVVQTFESPHFQKQLELLRRAHGPGDEVRANVRVARGTGEPLASHALTVIARLDDEEIERSQIRTDADGGAVIAFTLPERIERGDGLLTVMVSEGGMTESISRSIPIVLDRMELRLLPEGGDLVEGLVSRVYFQALNAHGQPADVAGEIRDDLGGAVARFESHYHGMGRFDLRPAPGRRYHAVITRPVGIRGHYDLPLPREQGCVLRTYDDFDGVETALRAAVRCTEDRTVVVSAMLRENLLDVARVEAGPDAPAVVHLKPEDEALARAQGVARITVFDDDLSPLAERVVFRNRRSRLGIAVEPMRAHHGPRDQVALKVRTTDLDGTPIPAELALSVVDDTILRFADDKNGHMLSRLFIEPELPGEIREPNFYVDLTEDRSPLALELLMGTRGYRRFEWQPVLDPEPAADDLQVARARGTTGARLEEPTAPAEMADVGAADEEVTEVLGGLRAEADARRMAAQRRARSRAAPAQQRRPDAPAAPQPRRSAAPRPSTSPPPPAAEPPVAARRRVQAEPAPPNRTPGRRPPPRPPGPGDVFPGAEREMPSFDPPATRPAPGRRRPAPPRPPRPQIAVARAFPAPIWHGDDESPRTDFRPTVHWDPSVRTGRDGEAIVTFHLSDAVTAFRVTSEGIGRGLAGRDETVINSTLPFRAALRMPVAVTAGDRILLPLSVRNEREARLSVAVEAEFGDGLELDESVALTPIEVAGGEGATRFFPLTVGATTGTSRVAIHAAAGELSDELEREVRIVPAGFPAEAAFSGRLDGRSRHEIDLAGVVPGTVEAELVIQPSTLSELTSGLEGMLRMPHGCFEQTSSTNHPNVLVLRHLKASGRADSALLGRTHGFLVQGYTRLGGFEAPSHGFEWFGSDPAHPGLTAYALMQFTDMADVYEGVDPALLDRTRRKLLSFRDGRGGFSANGRAAGRGGGYGRAAPEVLDAYATFALVKAGERRLQAEIERQIQAARRTDDAYQLALATRTLAHLPAHREAATAAARRLAAMQERDGAWRGADHTITRSGGHNLHVETTAMALLALMEAGGHRAAVDRGIAWLQSARRYGGRFGATQATVLALEALTRYAETVGARSGRGRVVVRVDGRVVADAAVAAGATRPVRLTGIGGHLGGEKHTVELAYDGGGAVPYTLQVRWRTTEPASSPRAAVQVETALARDQVPVGETVRLTAEVRNVTERGQPMTLARIGLPGGLEAQAWQLRELREQGVVDFFETGPQEVVAYFRGLSAGETRTVPLDLVAAVPGTYTGPATAAYLYYTDEHKHWAPPVKVTVDAE